MEKYCKSCGRVFKDLDFIFCPYCGNQLSTRVGRQPIPRKLRHEVFKRDGYRCRECGATNKQTRLHIDHIIPVAKGGTNDLSNLQTLCEECNVAKATDEWVGGVSQDDVILKSSVLPGIPLYDFEPMSEEDIFINNLEVYGYRLINRYGSKKMSCL